MPKPEKDAPKTPEHRYLVIGSSGYNGVDSIEWDTSSLPNIVDYDTVIVDVHSLDDNKIKIVSEKFLDAIKIQLIRLLDSNGELIVLTDFYHEDQRPRSYPEEIGNYDWCPIKIGIAGESGETIIKKNVRFENYLNKLSNWPYYLFLPKECLKQEIINYYGSTYNTRYNTSSDPILINRYEKVLAGAYRIEIRHGTTNRFGTRDFPTEADKVTGEIILLPLITGLEPKQAVSMVLECLIGKTVLEKEPDWVAAIKVPCVNKIDGEIITRREKINDAFSEIEVFSEKRCKLLDFKQLLFASGKQLEDIVAKSLVQLGGIMKPAKYGQEEYILEFGGSDYLIEVKGVSKSISLEHIRQLTDYLLRYEEETGHSCKGILFGNTWRNIPPDQRGIDDYPEFPANVVARANQLQISLVSSVCFFSAFCKFLNDNSRAKKILERMTSANGIAKLT